MRCLEGHLVEIIMLYLLFLVNKGSRQMDITDYGSP